MHEISQDLNHSIEGLTSALEYFSNQGHLESLPLSVFVSPLFHLAPTTTNNI